jgi:hypothetical protein
LLFSVFFALLRRPIFLIGHPSSPKPGRLDASLRTVPIQVMIRLKSLFAPFEKARSRTKSGIAVLRGWRFAIMV